MKLLDQFKEFDSLHWFDEVATKYNKDAKATQAQLNDNKQKEDQQTLILTLKKIKQYQTEFDLLRYSFDGARIFFKYERDVVSKAGEEKEKKEDESSKQQNEQHTSAPQSDSAPPDMNGGTPSMESNGAPPPPPPPPPMTH